MMASAARLPSDRTSAEDEAATAYDAVGTGYRAYADGDVRRLFDFSSRYSFADREIWQRIDAILVELRAAGRLALTIVDAGCGPGTWLLRVVLRARALGFREVVAHGFDISPAMIDLAREGARGVAAEGTRLTFEVNDIRDGLERCSGAPADLVLCLYGVLNHLPASRHGEVAAWLARATAGSLLVTARTIGSQPSIFVAGIEAARDFRQDNHQDRLSIDLLDGRHLEFSSHLFSASELTALFASAGELAEIVGLDLFHGRFSSDRRWNPPMDADRGFDDALVRLEHLCGSDPRFIDRAAHVLLHLRRVGDPK